MSDPNTPSERKPSGKLELSSHKSVTSPSQVPCVNQWTFHGKPNSHAPPRSNEASFPPPMTKLYHDYKLKTHFKYKKLKVKEQRNIYHVNINQRKSGIAILKSDKSRFQSKKKLPERGKVLI